MIKKKESKKKKTANLYPIKHLTLHEKAWKVRAGKIQKNGLS